MRETLKLLKTSDKILNHNCVMMRSSFQWGSLVLFLLRTQKQSINSWKIEATVFYCKHYSSQRFSTWFMWFAIFLFNSFSNLVILARMLSFITGFYFIIDACVDFICKVSGVGFFEFLWKCIMIDINLLYILFETIMFLKDFYGSVLCLHYIFDFNHSTLVEQTIFMIVECNDG